VPGSMGFNTDSNSTVIHHDSDLSARASVRYSF